MQGSVLTSPKERMGNHLAVLKKYAERVLTEGEYLMPWEEADKAARMEDFFDIGASFKCTQRDLVSVIVRDACQSG
ncbi:MAG: hypothetical protein BZY80_04150 [SAR202 cluster bacterium Io17-Chloro-G2]|nr:MAG: hypothetical protein BZY80_04150 [SAR202 cluster bacterium Io17-Chloro-G2]